ncbi:electron transporter heat shock binding [Micractinium conductrix]|uniref:Electron transporter heat shock binding n=1 Tax=Micractinium conductrix TaxID=554055 RepID=A0A2P6VN45_9CHLO|nr:electron transporter heat shock binding [Micractinium conductrix]|eukprot:PSC75503.1 electron transporter heat shock binding [Micractinium conductrix]
MWGADGQEADEAADYYAILDVPSTASTDEIKRAYRRLAKEFHPDVSADESNTEFQMFLNDVYQTLLDPEKRAAYDMIAGFQIGGVNPFMDTSYERDMVFVDEFTCIGCRNCNNVCPKTYEMEDEWGRARVMQQGVDGTEKLQESIDTCPVSCIHWVTAPQLALLEETMARMERVAAFLLLNNGGKGANLNVFVEASIAWQKRQSALVAKAQAAQGWGSMFTSPAAGSSMQDAARAAAEGGGASSALGRGINAASVAAAARRWRDYQRAKRTREQRLLTVSSSASVDASVDAALQSSDSISSVDATWNGQRSSSDGGSRPFAARAPATHQPHRTQASTLTQDMAAQAVVATAQVLVVLVQWQRAQGRLMMRVQPAIVLAIVVLGLAIMRCSTKFYLRHRSWLLPLLRVATTLPPSTRRVGVGTAVILERAAQPGVVGAVIDVLRVITGTRLLPYMLFSVFQAPLPPLAALVTQAALTARTFNSKGYCSTPLLSSALSRERQARLATGLEYAAMALTAVQPVAGRLVPAADVIAGHAPEEAVCHAVMSLVHLTLGLLAPTLLAKAAGRYAMPRRFQARGNASLMSFSTGSSGTRFDWELPRHGASLSYTPDVGAALLRLPSWTPMRIHRRGSDGFTRSDARFKFELTPMIQVDGVGALLQGQPLAFASLADGSRLYARPKLSAEGALCFADAPRIAWRGKASWTCDAAVVEVGRSGRDAGRTLRLAEPQAPHVLTLVGEVEHREGWNSCAGGVRLMQAQQMVKVRHAVFGVPIRSDIPTRAANVELYLRCHLEEGLRAELSYNPDTSTTSLRVGCSV